MFKEWNDIISRCAYDNNIRVLVITGNGRAFSSGVDLSVLGSDKYDPAQFRYYYRQNHMGFDNLEALEKPVIAAINGLCYGGGVELALSCDILFAADDAKFCLIENHIGCIPASGACNRMIHYVGLAKTKEMVISGEPIDAQEAWRIGFVNHVVRPTGPAQGSLRVRRQPADQGAFRHGHGQARHQSVPQHRHAHRPLSRTPRPERAGAVARIIRKACRRSSRSESRSSRASRSLDRGGHQAVMPISRILPRARAMFPDRLAIWDGEVRHTFEQLGRRVDALVGALKTQRRDARRPRCHPRRELLNLR